MRYVCIGKIHSRVLCSLIECEQVQITAVPTKYLSQLVCLRACWNECPMKQICGVINFVEPGSCLKYPLKKKCLCSYIAQDKTYITHIRRHMQLRVHYVADIWITPAISLQPRAGLKIDWIRCFYLDCGHVWGITQNGTLTKLNTILRKNGSVSVFENFGILCDKWHGEKSGKVILTPTCNVNWNI
jgi:hypothetical protein